MTEFADLEFGINEALIPDEEGVHYPGDIVWENVILYSHADRSLDISDMVMELNIFEDLFEPVLTGNVSIVDNISLSSFFPITGQERISVKFRTPTKNNVELTFRVFSMTNRMLDKERQEVYTLNLVSQEMITNLQTRISKAFSGTTSTAATEILTGFLNTPKAFFIEPTVAPLKCIIPNWHPFTALSWLAKRSISSTSLSANFTFYENTRGFVFTSLDTLVNPDLTALPAAFYNFQPNSVRSEGNFIVPEGEKDLAADMQSIYVYKIENVFDVVKSLAGGMLSSRLIKHDILTKSYTTYDFDYLAEYVLHNHLETNTKIAGQGITALYHTTNDTDSNGKTISGYPLTTLKVYPEHLYNYDSSLVPTTLGNFSEIWLQRRLSSLQELSSISMTIQVPGDSERRIGEVVEVNLPKTSHLSEENITDRLDPLLAGRYLIMKLRHKIQHGKYYLIMTLVKDSFYTPLPA